MMTRAQLDRWGPAMLGVVCLLLIVRVISQLRAGPGWAVRSAPVRAAAAVPSKAVRKARSLPNASMEYDSSLNLKGLEQFENRPMPEFERNPFEFVVPKPPPAESAANQAAAPPLAPPPPPLPLKALGFAEEAGGIAEAYVTYEDQVFVVRVGDSISGRYKIINVTPLQVEVEDAVSGQKGDLPIPNAQ